jgi:hypothetical protein
MRTFIMSSRSSPAATSRSGRHAWYLTLSSKPSLPPLPPTKLLQPAASVFFLRRRTNSNTSSASVRLMNLSGWRRKPPWVEQRASKSGEGVTISSWVEAR